MLEWNYNNVEGGGMSWLREVEIGDQQDYRLILDLPKLTNLIIIKCN
jgi:hypothetical protein